MLKAWKIKDWGRKRGRHRLFVVSQSGEVTAPAWVPFPINLTGERYRVLMSSTEGQSAYAIFCALVCVAAHCPCKGVLIRESGPFSLRALSVLTGAPPADIEKAINLLSDPEIGWLESVSAREVRRIMALLKSEPTRSELGDSSKSEEKQSRAEEREIKPLPAARAPAPEQRPEDLSATGSACLPAGLSSVREVLAACGVGEPALSTLSRCNDLTVAVVQSAWAQIQRRGPKLHDPVRVLIASLAKAHGVKLKPKSQVGCVALDALNRSIIEQRNRIRRGETQEHRS
jgi:hypothetical protein